MKKFEFKQFVKKITGLGVLTPELYYGKSIDFAFFPRPNDDWLNSFYTEQGILDAKDSNRRRKQCLSPARAEEADLIFDFVVLNIPGRKKLNQ